MKSFKNLWVFLVLVLALAVFAGCQNTPKPTPDNGDQGGEQTGDHTHAWGNWTVTKNATCTEEGVETRTCECGDSETRKIDKVDHNYQLVKLVPATATTKGVQEHYECSECHKYFLKDGETYKEVEFADLLFKSKSSGCQSSVATPSLIVLVSAGALSALLMLRKKEER